MANTKITSDNLDTNIDIAGTLGVTGVVTANAGVSIDNITIDGTEIDLSSGDLTIDVAGDIILDAAGDNWLFKKSGTTLLNIQKDSDNVEFISSISDGDMKFRGSDSGSIITALNLDMSNAGDALFNSRIFASGGTGTNTSVHADDLVLGLTDNATERGLTIASTVGGGIRWNDGADSGVIQYSHSSNEMYYSSASHHRFVGTADAAGMVKINTSDAGGGVLNVKSADVTEDGVGSIGIQSPNSALRIGGTSGRSWIQSHSSQPLYINKVGNNVILNADAGNVGIRITDPDQALEIGAAGKLKLSRADNARSMLLFTDNSNGTIQTDVDPILIQSADRIDFNANGANAALRINTNGIVDANATKGRMSAKVQNMFHIGADQHDVDRYVNIGRTYVDGGSSNYQGYVYATETYAPSVYIPYSPNQVYRLSASIHQLTNATGGTDSRHYIGVIGYDENFSFLAVDDIGTYQYNMASNTQLIAGNTLEVDVTLKGWQGAGSADGNKMDQGCVYIRPLILFNYARGGATAVLTGFTIMPAGTIADNDSNAGTNY